MSIQLGSAYGKIVIDSSGVSVGVGNATKSLGSLSDVAMKVGQTMQQVGQAMTIGLTLLILAVGAGSIKAASDLNESVNKIKVVFGGASDSVLKWSSDSAKAFGQSKQQALEAAGTFGNLFTSMGLAKDKSAEMSTTLVTLASDLGSFNNIDPSVVLEKLQGGIVGETRAVRDLGIDLRQTTVEAKAQELGFQKLNGQYSEANLIAARYALIMEQTKNAQGDFARTSGDLANSTRILKAELADAAANLGKSLLPLTILVVKGLTKLLEMFNNAPPFVQKAILIFLAFVAALGPVLMILGWLIQVFAALSSVVSAFGGLAAVAGVVGPALTAIVGGFAGMVVAALPVVGPILLIVGALALLYFAFKNNFMGITDTAKQLWFLIKLYFGNILKSITETFKKINWGEIGKSMLQGLANGMIAGISYIVTAARNAGAAALDAIKASLGIHSPSLEFMKLGKFSGQGFQMGLANAMDPNMIARTMAKPVQNMSSQQSTVNTIHLSGGLTLRDMDALMNEKINRFALRAAGGV